MKKLYFLCNLSVLIAVFSIRTYAQCPEVIYGGLGSSLELYPFGWVGGQYFSPAAWNNIGVFPGNHGEEKITKFTPPANGTYEIAISHSFSWGGMSVMWRTSNNICDLTGYQYPSNFNTPDPTHSNFTLGNLVAGINYNIIVYPYDSGVIGNATLIANCANAKNLSISNIQTTSAVLNFNAASPNPVILEYGPSGFTPGTGTSGNGTMVANVTSPYTITGLSPYKFYDVYLRSACGTIYTDNAGTSFRTSIDCANAPVLTCGSTFTYQHNIGDNSGNWNITCPSTSANSSYEAVYRFTPTQTGNYLLTNSGGTGYNGNSIAAYYKPMGSCDATGWNCIGAVTHQPQGLSFGPLTANTTYLLLFDANSSAGNTSKNMRLDCIMPCAPATITPSSTITICQGMSTTLQANTGAGITHQWYHNGLLVAGATASSYTTSVDGWYSVVENTPCGSITSDNTYIYVSTTAGAAVTNNTALTFCPNGYVQLNANSNYYATTYQWQRNGANIPGATQVSYQATDSGSYRVRASAANCTAAFSYSVTVNKATSVTGFSIATPQTTICAGGNILLSLRNSQSPAPGYIPIPGYTYQWKKNGVNISGANSTTYNVTTAGSYTCLITATCGTFTTVASVINASSMPTVSLVANGPTTFCNSQVNLTATLSSGVSTIWKRNGVAFFSGFSQVQTASETGTYVCEATNACGTVVSNAIIVTANKRPVITAITGNTGFCRPSTGNIYSVTPQAGVTFNWTLPTGATVISGQGTNSITVSFASNAAAGNICVTGSNAVCGAGTATCKSILLRTAVSIPGAFTGSSSASCTLSKIYSIRKVANAEYYIWTPPAGAKINGSAVPLLTTDTMVVLKFDSTFAGDTLRVKAVNCIGMSAERKLKIKNNLPATPGTITGNVYANCNKNTIYSIAPAANAVSYTWRTTVPGATIAGSSLPYTTTYTSADIHFTNGLSGKVYVKANSVCNISAEKSLNVYAKPANPTVINGLSTVCDSAQLVNFNTPLITGATSYNWTVISGSTIANGQGTNAINVNFGGIATTGSIKVRAQNVCANSSYFSKPVTINNCNRLMDFTAKDDLKLYPNPFSSTAILIIPAETNLNACEVSIYDVFGKQVRVISKPEQHALEIERKNLSSGIYFIKVTSGGMENQIIKMIVE